MFNIDGLVDKWGSLGFLEQLSEHLKRTNKMDN